ncbi:hypothetical protein EV359DRAFT_45007 [Lentinula novae-zelandiae]|nr:hypothetical protein EV359DRAFT_45007 [Lentinula novae-zelandiae]
MPGKPKQHHINHTLRILVKQLLAFWEGVYYTRTARHRIGQKVFVVLLPVVCDTEAAIQISGFAAHNHTYFCRRCLLPISDIYNLDPETWIMRDPAKHRELAFEWKIASPARRDAIYKAHGIRFTELMELPYWDPILFTVIDDMHFGYLGLFKTHLREIWGIDHEKNSGDGLHPDLSQQATNGRPDFAMGEYWISLTTYAHLNMYSDLLAEVWADMARSVLPSWIQPAPSRWGIPSAGKLSADEYKVVCSISLVVTLIRVWGYGNKEQPQSRHFQMMLNFLELVRGMHIIFLRETSHSSRAYYKARILSYLHGILELFPDVTLASNHHLALHVITDLENMGPGHARSTPVFERINHLLQEIKKNGHLGELILKHGFLFYL